MYNMPQISNKECESLSHGMKLYITKGTGVEETKFFMRYSDNDFIDSSYSFTDQRYKKSLNGLFGHILIQGLGFGCNIIRACAKDNVNSVTVVEINPEVVALFYQIHGRKFKGFEKLTIIITDAKTYMKNDFDCVFIDIYHTPIDREEYEKTMNMLKKRYKNSELFYLEL